MSLITIPRFLLRAPLLPVRALAAPTRALLAHPLGAEAVEIGRPAAAALERYARRAAFRPTPRGLWAGVTVGDLGAATRIHTAPAGTARVTVSWGRLAALGRALLDDPGAREHANLRCAPSLLARNGWAQWLLGGELREAEVTGELAALLDATAAWTQWARVRAVAAEAFGAPADQVDDLLLAQIDDGLLLHDLAPPLVGPPPLTWAVERLSSAGPLADAARAVDEVARVLAADPAAADLATARSLLAALPGASSDDPLHAVLEVTCVAPPRLSQAAVLRAAGIAPLLHRLQEALAPPVAERALDPSVAGAAELAVETFGAGALDLAALALGDYGMRPGADAAGRATPAVPAPLLALLVDRIAAAIAGDGVARFTVDELDAVLPAADPPPTFELTLSPAREPRRAPPGTDWLVGLHAPAGATWGRFVHALGEPLAAALGDLAAAEREARPAERRLDVAYAPSAATADLATHPPLREASLALTSWPAAPAAIAPADLRLATDPPALSAAGADVTPSPLARIRSTTAPPGVYQLLVGWSLHRQHAPWALAAGPLADLAHFPRVTVDGFVIAPASWRLPASLTRAALARWRREARVPRHIQIGHEDELFLVDLDAPGAVADIARLAGAARAWEVWPPLHRLVDRGGRRIEAVVAVITSDPAPEVAPPADTPPPDVRLPAPGWRTWRIYGDDERQDRVLAGAIAPAIAAARAAREIDGWFFLRYVDPGPAGAVRPHLRVRARAPVAAGTRAFEDRLHAALAPAREAADVVTVDAAEYYPETARFGGAAEGIFEAESDLVCALLGADGGDLDDIDHAVCAVDALATGLGLAPADRHALARERRGAAGAGTEAAADYRRRQGRLMAALTDPPPPFTAHARRLRAIPRPPVRAMPALLHLCVNRLAGTDAAVEARVYYLWERTLDSLRARAAKDSPKGSPPPQGRSSSRRRS